MRKEAPEDTRVPGGFCNADWWGENNTSCFRGRLLVIWWDISHWQKDCTVHPLDPFFRTRRSERNAWNDVGAFIFPLLLHLLVFWAARLGGLGASHGRLWWIKWSQRSRAQGSSLFRRGFSEIREALGSLNAHSGPHDHVIPRELAEERVTEHTSFVCPWS